MRWSESGVEMNLLIPSEARDPLLVFWKPVFGKIQPSGIDVNEKLCSRQRTRGGWGAEENSPWQILIASSTNPQH
jgi:hypothetical protein